MTDPDERLLCLRAWLRTHDEVAACELTAASGDASFRRYYRARVGDKSFIVMDAPPDKEDCRPFIKVAALLRVAGLHAPRILAQDLEKGFLLLTDLGMQTYLDVLTPDNADGLFQDAIAALIRWQVASKIGVLPAYDHTLLARELNLFTQWYLPKHLGVVLNAESQFLWEQVCALLIESALSQACVYVHRDYMPRNLMVSDPNPGVLDFQDAVFGPVTYDAVCLFKDAFISWPEARVDQWSRQYWERARAAVLPVHDSFADFRRAFDWMGLQRHLKVLGIFSRLTHRDGKPGYARDTPRFVRYVTTIAARYDELAPLARLFEQHVLPRVSL
ncbi:MAG: phosphotransferase [Gammaproteobacteria bacterium]|nr:phosphotransferase [Gammaproteobacteria bacterium]